MAEKTKLLTFNAPRVCFVARFFPLFTQATAYPSIHRIYFVFLLHTTATYLQSRKRTKQQIIATSTGDG